jgi:hypothetical protein
MSYPSAPSIATKPSKEKKGEEKLYTAQELASMVKALRKEARFLKSSIVEKDEELAAMKVSFSLLLIQMPY